MTPMTFLAQFPWPLFLGAGVGLALAVGVSLRGLRSERRGRILAVSASAVAGASTGAFAGLVWLWVGPMSTPVACLYACNEVVQFLSNEQFRQIVLMTDLAWVLPVTVLLSAAVAVWSCRCGPRR
ncbi:hypothetical protein ACWIDS_02165 [Dietzia maris]